MLIFLLYMLYYTYSFFWSQDDLIYMFLQPIYPTGSLMHFLLYLEVLLFCWSIFLIAMFNLAHYYDSIYTCLAFSSQGRDFIYLELQVYLCIVYYIIYSSYNLRFFIRRKLFQKSIQSENVEFSKVLTLGIQMCRSGVEKSVIKFDLPNSRFACIF